MDSDQTTAFPELYGSFLHFSTQIYLVDKHKKCLAEAILMYAHKIFFFCEYFIASQKYILWVLKRWGISNVCPQHIIPTKITILLALYISSDSLGKAILMNTHKIYFNGDITINSWTKAQFAWFKFYCLHGPSI